MLLARTSSYLLRRAPLRIASRALAVARAAAARRRPARRWSAIIAAVGAARATSRLGAAAAACEPERERGGRGARRAAAHAVPADRAVPHGKDAHARRQAPAVLRGVRQSGRQADAGPARRAGRRPRPALPAVLRPRVLPHRAARPARRGQVAAVGLAREQRHVAPVDDLVCAARALHGRQVAHGAWRLVGLDARARVLAGVSERGRVDGAARRVPVRQRRHALALRARRVRALPETAAERFQAMVPSCERGCDARRVLPAARRATTARRSSRPRAASSSGR